MGLVSVIIPTFNRAKYIGSSLESVLAQKLPKGYQLEVIVADDGSTDNTKQVLEQYIDRITYIELPHSGLPAVARNHAIRASTGEIIAFQDSDDIWTEDKLIRQLGLFSDPKIVMSFGNAKIMDSTGTITSDRLIKNRYSVDSIDFGKLLETNHVCTLTVMLRRSVIDEVGHFNESPSLKAIEDYELWLRIANKYPKGLRYLDNALAIYRVHSNNISTADSLLALKRIAKVYSYVWDYASTESHKLKLEKAIRRINQSITNTLLEPNNADKRPTVSILLPAYNAEKYIKKTLSGILHQTLSDLEVIVINDGSSDSTKKIIESLDDDRIRLINQINKGLCKTLNAGIELCAGRYIARHDADDISMPSRIELQVKYLDSHTSIGLLGTFFCYVDEVSGNPLGTTVQHPINHDDIKRSMYFVNPIGHGTIMIRREIINAIDNPYQEDYFTAEDYKLWSELIDKTKFAILPEVLYQYRINPDGIASTKNKQMALMTKQVQDELHNKPFAFKKARQVFSDIRYYKSIDAVKDTSTRDAYISQEIRLNIHNFKIGRRLHAIKNSLALAIAEPKSIKHSLKVYRKLTT